MTAVALFYLFGFDSEAPYINGLSQDSMRLLRRRALRTSVTVNLAPELNPDFVVLTRPPANGEVHARPNDPVRQLSAVPGALSELAAPLAAQPRLSVRMGAVSSGMDAGLALRSASQGCSSLRIKVMR